MLDKYVPTVPMGKVRQSLAQKGRMQNIKVKRYMSPKEVNDLVVKAFGIEGYTVLECDVSGHNLVKSSEQEIDGDAAVGRIGCLYLCEKFEDSGSSAGPSCHRRMKALATEMVSDDSDFEEYPFKQKGGILPDKNRSDPINFIGKGKGKAQETPPSSHDFIDLYSASDDDETLLQLLRAKWTKLDFEGGLKFSIRFPDSSQLNCSVPKNVASKALYEISYAFGNIQGPICAYTLMPRVSIPCDDSPLHVTIKDHPAVLVVEENDVHGYPLECLDDGATRAEEIEVRHTPDWDILAQADASRLKYMMDTLDTHQGLPHCITRSCIFEDGVELYRNKLQEILDEFPFRICYDQERAVDTGGVCRDFFSGFWESVYSKSFDGGGSLIPAVHAQVDMSLFPVLGSILVHGFMTCGFLPVRIVFPVIAGVLLGPDVKISDEILLDTFMDYISVHERSIFQEALEVASKSSSSLTSFVPKLIDILSRFGCRRIPTANNIQQLIIDVARYEFSVKTLAVTHAMRVGVPTIYSGFWENFTTEELFTLYKALTATPSSVLRMILEPVAMNAAEERVYGYLISFVGNLRLEELRLFLRFITGSSVCIDKKIEITFNNLTGAARRLLGNTCSCTLDVPLSYATYPEFSEEFLKILTSELSWDMDAV